MATTTGFAGFMVVVLIVELGNVALTVWALVDATSRSRIAFYVAGFNRTAWIVVLATTFFTGFGFVPAIVYLATARRRVASAALQGF